VKSVGSQKKDKHVLSHTQSFDFANLSQNQSKRVSTLNGT